MTRFYGLKALKHFPVQRALYLTPYAISCASFPGEHVLMRVGLTLPQCTSHLTEPSAYLIANEHYRKRTVPTPHHHILPCSRCSHLDDTFESRVCIFPIGFPPSSFPVLQFPHSLCFYFGAVFSVQLVSRCSIGLINCLASSRLKYSLYLQGR